MAPTGIYEEKIILTPKEKFSFMLLFVLGIIFTCLVPVLNIHLSYLIVIFPFLCILMYYRYRTICSRGIDYDTWILLSIFSGLGMFFWGCYGIFLNSDYYWECKKRGYFIPTKNNKRLHIVRKLRGEFGQI